MGLREHEFKISYGPADDRLQEFYIPALSRSVGYDRSAGFFSSSALAAAATGVARLIQNGGRMRLLVGASLDDDDIAAIRAGHDLAARVGERMLATLADPADALQRKRLEVLAWMVAAGTLEIRVVLPKGADGHPIPAAVSQDYYHPKEGVFTDEQGDQIAFSGSINESAGGWQRNYEQFMVYRSWDETRPYLAQVVQRFERLWDGREEDWIALSVPEAVRQRLLEFRPERAPKLDPGELLIDPEEQRERILFQFIRDAPFLPTAGRLGIETSAVTPWPHQERVVETVVERFPERFMLCDEVGLGKTIEAGLAIRQLVISGRVKRCLILVPKSVARQWQEELYEKFVLNVPFYDGQAFTDVFRKPLSPDAANPWDAYPVLLSSSQLAKRRERQSDLLRAQPWDLVVVDEAHHARRRDFLQIDRYRPNRLLELLNQLSERTDGMLLLTATPMQIHPVEVWDLLRVLGVGGRWGAAQDNFLRYFEELAKPFDEVDWDFVFEMLQDGLEENGLDPAFCEYARGRVGLVEWQQIQGLPASPKRQTTLRQLSTAGRAVVAELARRHTPVKRFIFRNTRSLLREYQKRGLLTGSIPHRDPQPRWVPMQPEERRLYDRIEEYITDFYEKYEAERRGLGFIMTVYRRRLTSSFYAVHRSLQRRLAFLRGQPEPGTVAGLDDDDLEQEDLQRDVTEEISDEDRDLFRGEIEYVRDFLSELRQLTTDSKLEHLLQELASVFRRRETVLIFTQYTDTMDYLRERLRQVYGSQVACYSGRGGEYWDGARWALTTKERIKNEFLRGEELKILIGTEALSEGLNLESCGVLINYDVPWNPMRVEQRIGRIDRIGQRHDPVWVRNYFYEGTVEAIVYQRLQDRINWFGEVVGPLQPILSQVARSIQTLAMTKAAERQQRLEEEVAQLRRELEAREVDLLHLDENAQAGIAETVRPRCPLTLSDLESFVVNSRVLGGRLTPHPQIEGAYQLQRDNEPVGVTFKAEVFDQHPSTVRLLSFGDEVLEELLREVSAPVPSETENGILRLSADRPIPLRGYFMVEGERARSLDNLGALETALTTHPTAPGDAKAGMEDAERLFQGNAEKVLTNLEAASQHRARARTRALQEQARLLLLRAAMVELAIAQHPDLFSEQEAPFEFSEEAVFRLRQHGYPFAGLLRLTDVRGLRPSPADPFFAQVQTQSREALRRRFDALRDKADELLREMTRTGAIGREPAQLVSGDTADLRREFLAWPETGRPGDAQVRGSQSADSDRPAGTLSRDGGDA